MPLTPEQALTILTSRGLQVRPVENGWVAETRRGTRLHRDPKPTPNDALEAAEVTLLATTQRDQEQRAGRLLEALARGRYFLRPRIVMSTDPKTGQPISQLVFDAFHPDNTPIGAVRGRESYLQAVLDVEALLGP